MTINLWVTGQEYAAHCDKTIDVENPAIGKVVDQLALADKHCLDQVVEIARQAQKEWARTALAKRVDIMFKFRQLVIEHQDEIADAIVFAVLIVVLLVKPAGLFGKNVQEKV